MSEQIDNAEFFDDLLSISRDACGASGVLGLTFVPQEGPNAGRLTSSHVPKQSLSSEIQARIDSHCGQILNFQTRRQDFSHNDLPFRFRALKGQFGSVVVILWWSENDTSFKANLPLAPLKRYILSAIENSKKSYFHTVFRSEILHFNRETLYDSLQNTLRNGLFCDKVLIWRRRRNVLKCESEPGLDLMIKGSLAGQAITGRTQAIHDFEQLPKGRIQHLDYLKENNLNAAFFIPIFGIYEEPGAVGAVAGVFYHRRKGTTKIDQELAEYAVRYFELVWSQKKTIDRLTEELGEMTTIKPFYRPAISALAAFHDLTAIHLGLSSSIGSAKSYAHNREDIEQKLVFAEARLKEFKEILDNNRDALTVAPQFLELIASSDKSHATMFNLEELARTEVSKVEGEARVARATIKLSYRMRTTTIIGIKDDYKKVLTNLLTNAVRAVARRSHGGGRIIVVIQENPERGVITLSVADNGIGVKEDDKKRVWDVHWSTHASEGGRGLGLAIVRAISKKYGTEPTLESKWGFGAEFEVTIGYERRN